VVTGIKNDAVAKPSQHKVAFDDSMSDSQHSNSKG